MIYFLIALAFSSLIGVIVFLSSNNGKKTAELENLKADLRKEIRERENASKITNSVNNMSSDTVRDRLQNISSKQQ